MGAWGYENIENDTAQDMLAEMCDGYFRRITDALRSEHGHEYDEYEHDEIFVLSEMLFAMNEREMVNSSPEPDVLRPLLAPHVFGGQLSSARRARPPAEHQNHGNTFRKLTEIAARACQGSFNHRLGLRSHRQDVQAQER
ncbi:MAG: DUF4259 domain-containing protein [Chthoniobacteraceae bacterium]